MAHTQLPSALGSGFGFPKAERLCSRQAIAHLWAQGRQLPGRPVRAVYCTLADCLAASTSVPRLLPLMAQARASGLPATLIVVPKRLHRRAHTRNLLKRRMREAYRMQKHVLKKLPEANRIVLLAWICTDGKEFDLAKVEKKIASHLQAICQQWGAEAQS